MQPTLALTAPHPGILYINGRFTGEICPDSPLMRPISSRGAVYLDYRPLSDGCHSLARKLVFSGGMPLPESAEEAPGLEIIIWPGAVIEIEINPPPRVQTRSFSIAGRNFTLDSGRLSINGNPLATLPADASPPQCRQMSVGNLFIGDCSGGQYLLTTDPSFQHQTGFLHAHHLDISEDGRIQALLCTDDLVGHATKENWQLTPDGLMLLSSETSWIHGAPRWPRTPAETARAAVEAMLSGHDEEAEGYLTPSMQARIQMDDLRSRCDLCVEMKYAPPDCSPCVGLLQLQGAHMGRVRPLYYRAVAGSGVQGPWQIDQLDLSPV